MNKVESDLPVIEVSTPVLVPTIEFEPFVFQVGDEPPAGEEYWSESLAQSDVFVDPIQPGLWLVPISGILEVECLSPILKDCMVDEESGELFALEEVTPLSGGPSLCEADSVLVTPNCCGDLGDIHGWRSAALESSVDRAMLWGGHPWLMVRTYDADRLMLEETAEHGDPNELRAFVVHSAKLLKAADVAAKQMERFGRLLDPYLCEQFGIFSDVAYRFSQRLIGLDVGA